MNKKTRQVLGLGALVTIIGVGLTVVYGCGSDPAKGYVQIERLGRPAINEGLVLSNKLLNAYNSVGPTVDLTDTGADIRTEVATVLGLLRTLGTALGGSPPTLVAVVEGFLPDVMRINTAVASGYNADTGTTSGGFAMLTGGRKISDDVADITLCYTVMGQPNPDSTTAPLCPAALKDKVSFTSHGKTALSTSFPYLAAPY